MYEKTDSYQYINTAPSLVFICKGNEVENTSSLEFTALRRTVNKSKRLA